MVDIRNRLKMPLSIFRCVAILILATLTADRVYGQAQLADDLVIISKGVREQERARDDLHLGSSPGSLDSRLTNSPGSGESTLGHVSPIGQRRDVLSAASTNAQSIRFRQSTEALPPPELSNPVPLPASGPLDLPNVNEEGPVNGLTLEAAIDLLTSQNLDLRTKFQEIPKAEADILTAGLRANPLIFGAVDNIPYGQYTPQRPGETGYGVTVIQPFDVNHKRLYRVSVAERARSVLQAQYQNAVRLEIENLQTAYVDVLAAREHVRYVEASIKGLDELKAIVSRQIKGRQTSTLDLNRANIQRDSAELALEEANAALAKAKQTLATMLNLPIADLREFNIRGSIHGETEQFPSADDLVNLANTNRPDLTAYRLGVQRAKAEVDLSVKERYPDIFVLYSPFAVQDNRPTGGQNQTSWGISAMASVPIFNRNQGNIRRAEINVAQTRNEWVNLTRQVELEVRSTAKDVEVAQAAVLRIEKDLIPQAREMRDTTLRLMTAGEVDAVGYLSAQREYVDVIRQYRDALVRLRRASLKINTVVAVRVIP